MYHACAHVSDEPAPREIERRLDVVKILLENGANPYSTYGIDEKKTVRDNLSDVEHRSMASIGLEDLFSKYEDYEEEALDRLKELMVPDWDKGSDNSFAFNFENHDHIIINMDPNVLEYRLEWKVPDTGDPYPEVESVIPTDDSPQPRPNDLLVGFSFTEEENVSKVAGVVDFRAKHGTQVLGSNAKNGWSNIKRGSNNEVHFVIKFLRDLAEVTQKIVVKNPKLSFNLTLIFARKRTGVSEQEPRSQGQSSWSPFANLSMPSMPSMPWVRSNSNPEPVKREIELSQLFGDGGSQGSQSKQPDLHDLGGGQRRCKKIHKKKSRGVRNKSNKNNSNKTKKKNNSKKTKKKNNSKKTKKKNNSRNIKIRNNSRKIKKRNNSRKIKTRNKGRNKYRK